MPHYSDDFIFTLFTNNPDLAAKADAAGIDRIGLDLEYVGKQQRQGHLKAWISDHQESQIPRLAAVLKRARFFVRTNPIHAGSEAEIERFLAAGARTLMLPMFYTVQEAAKFVEIIGGRAEVSLLVETPAAAMRLHEIVRLPGIDEIHIGLNDMHLGMGLSSHFEVLASDFMRILSDTVNGAGIRFGFGGVGRYHDPRLPIGSDVVYAQYARLRGKAALISRVFTTPDYRQLDLPGELRQCRERLDYWALQTPEVLLTQRESLRDQIASTFGLGAPRAA